MSRGFFGGGGIGSSKNPFQKKAYNSGLMAGRKRRRHLQDLVEERITHKVKTQKEILEEMIEDRMYSLDKKSYGFQIPGTEQEEVKHSKGYIDAVELAKSKNLKKKIKLRDNAVKITPKTFDGEFGGRIDEKGRVVNKKGRLVLKVDPETGIIRNNMGTKVGKYNPRSFNCQFKMESLIARYSKTPGFGGGIGSLFGKKDD